MRGEESDNVCGRLSDILNNGIVLLYFCHTLHMICVLTSISIYIVVVTMETGGDEMGGAYGSGAESAVPVSFWDGC